MTSISDRQIVQDYCQKKNKSAVVTSLTYSVFQKQLEELIEDNTNKNGAPSSTRIEVMRTTLLSDASLDAQVRVSEEMLLSEIQNTLKPILRKESIKSFWSSVSASIVASFLYSFLIIILFIVTQEQLTTWLVSLTKKP